MRILYFSRDYSTHDHRFLKSISEAGHAVFYVRLERGARQVEDRPVPAGVEQVRWAGGRGTFRWRDLPRLVLDLKRVLRRVRPDLVHAGPIQTCAWIAVLTGFRPILTMSWGFDLMEDAHSSAWMERITRYVLRRSTFFTSDAQVTRDQAVSYGMDPDRTVIFPWGIDLDHYRAKTMERSNPPAFTLFCNRSWEPRYGVDLLASAFVQIAERRDDVGLILAGGGSQGPRIRQILMSGGVHERVTFGGQISQSDLPSWYHMADLYVSPSHVDGSSVSLMEALACGLPVLVSDIPANKEWVSEGVNGWLFPDGAVEGLADKVLAALDQQRRWPEIGRAARRTAEQRADWKANVQRLFEAYEQAVKLSERRST
jgi:glycosyltransferase involved in cell wall biosynthesis